MIAATKKTAGGLVATAGFKGGALNVAMSQLIWSAGGTFFDEKLNVAIDGKSKEAIKSVTDRVVEAVAICGTLESCRARLREMPELGATLTIVPIPSTGTTAGKCRIIESLIA